MLFSGENIDFNSTEYDLNDCNGPDRDIVNSENNDLVGVDRPDLDNVDNCKHKEFDRLDLDISIEKPTIHNDRFDSDENHDNDKLCRNNDYNKDRDYDRIYEILGQILTNQDRIIDGVTSMKTKVEKLEQYVYERKIRAQSITNSSTNQSITNSSPSLSVQQAPDNPLINPSNSSTSHDISNNPLMNSSTSLTSRHF